MQDWDVFVVHLCALRKQGNDGGGDEDQLSFLELSAFSGRSQLQTS